MKTIVILLLLGLTASGQGLPPGFRSTTLSTGWNEAVGLAFTGAGSQMVVWERPGRVWAVTNGQRRLLLDLSEEVGGWNDHGLLGLALDPQFAANGYFYLLYVVDRHHLLYAGTGTYSPTANEYFNATIGRLTRYTAAPTASGGLAVVAGSRRVLLGATAATGIPSTASGHVACALAFGTDGSLLVSTGDGAHPFPDAGSSPDSFFAQALADGIIRPAENVGSFRAQLVNCLNGKILRLDPATGQGLPTNPFYDPAAPDAPASKVWALGLRNPFRLGVQPETGSHDPAAGDPGTLYVGDVGAATWEEVSVVDGPGQNLGWPLYEGLVPNPAFSNRLTDNLDAPNPAPGAGCPGAYFTFQQLLRQAASPAPGPPASPCGGPLPAGVRGFVHHRPVLDYGHPAAGPVRGATFDGGGAATATPLAGAPFGGSAVVGGVFYPHHDFPDEYHDAYLFGDYTTGWIRALAPASGTAPPVLTPLVPSGAVVVGLATHPTEGGLYYVNFFPSEIRKISYNNPNPTAVATADRRYGPGPLAVQFTGSTSSSPRGGALQFAWDFGDGATSALPNPSHTFAPAGPAPAAYTVTLAVTDSAGRRDEATLAVSVNNTPPQVRITAPAAGTRYSGTVPNTFALRAAVTDAEHPAGQLRYAWERWLHHNTHRHLEPVDTARQSTLETAPLGCGVENYYYTVRLTVTDAAGLAAWDEVRLDPACGPRLTGFVLVNADTDQDIQPLLPGAILNLAALPTRNLNVRAEPDSGTVGSVRFVLSGAVVHTQTESIAPYALYSDSGGNYFAWTPPVGTYALAATPYAGPGGSGLAGTPRTLSFVVIDQPANGQATLAVAVVGSGTVARSPSQPSYPVGTVVTLTATPAVGFRFVGWSGDTVATTNPLALSLPASRSLTATFEQIAQQVQGFVLVNADNDQDIQALTTGAVLNLATLPTRNLNVRATTSPAAVGSVVFTLSGALARSHTESIAPYALFSDSGGDYNPWTPPAGSYTLTANAFTAAGSGGVGGTPRTVTFSVTDQAGPGLVNLSVTVQGSGTVQRSPALPAYPPGQLVTLTATPTAGSRFVGWSGDTVATANPLRFVLRRTRRLTAIFSASPLLVSSLSLINADTGQPILALATGASLNLATLPTRRLTIRANTVPSVVGSVVLDLSGTVLHRQVESVAPYALFSDDNGLYNPWTPPVGNYVLLSTPYAQGGGQGPAGTALTVAFSVTDSPAPPPGGGPGLLRAVVSPNPAPDGRYRLQLDQPVQGAWHYLLVSASGLPLAAGTRQLAPGTREIAFDFGAVLPPAPTLAHLLLYSAAQGRSRALRLRLARE